MILWISGIIEAEVNAAFFDTMKSVQKQLDEITSSNDFGDAVEKIRIVFIINRDPITEFRRFNKKIKTLDARVRIDYEEFLDSSSKKRIKMFVAALDTVLQKTQKFNESEFKKNKLMSLIDGVG